MHCFFNSKFYLSSCYTSCSAKCYAIKDWLKVAWFCSSLLYKNASRGLIRSGAQGHGIMNVMETYFLGVLVSSEEDVKQSRLCHLVDYAVLTALKRLKTNSCNNHWRRCRSQMWTHSAWLCSTVLLSGDKTKRQVGGNPKSRTYTWG